jgi:hypothetical protein
LKNISTCNKQDQRKKDRGNLFLGTPLTSIEEDPDENSLNPQPFNIKALAMQYFDDSLIYNVIEDVCKL